MGSKRVLFISPIPTHPQTAGNRTRVASLLQALKELGHDVIFLYIRQEPGDEAAMRCAWGDRFYAADWTLPTPPLYRRLLRKLLGRLSSDARYTLDIDEWYDPGIDPILSGLQARYHFDAVICSYVFFSRALKVFGPEVRKIIDTHDAFANRHRQYLERGETPAWFSTSPAGEGKAFRRADLVFSIQDKERIAFSRLAPTPVITLSHITALDRLAPSQAVRGRLLFVASDNTINVHGISTFIREALPGICAREPAAHLCLAGSICRSIDDHPNVVKLGRVDDLRSAYEAASVVVNPVLFNTGVSIKNLEALGYGKALVTATVGTDGMEDGAGKAYLVADTPAAFVDACVQVLSQTGARDELARAAYDYVSNCNREISTRLQAALNGETSL